MATPWNLITGVVTTYIDHRSKIGEAKRQLDLAIINNRARLAEDSQSNNADWEMASLQDKDKFLRRFTFILFTLPVVLVIVSPDYGDKVLKRLDILPEWMLHIYMYMIAGVWGISSLKNAVPQIIAGIRKG